MEGIYFHTRYWLPHSQVSPGKIVTWRLSGNKRHFFGKKIYQVKREKEHFEAEAGCGDTFL